MRSSSRFDGSIMQRIGAISRYLFSQWLNKPVFRIPIGTLAVYLLGSFLLGWMIGRSLSKAWILLLGTGFYGCFHHFFYIEPRKYPIPETERMEKDDSLLRSHLHLQNSSCFCGLFHWSMIRPSVVVSPCNINMNDLSCYVCSLKSFFSFLGQMAAKSVAAPSTPQRGDQATLFYGYTIRATRDKVDSIYWVNNPKIDRSLHPPLQEYDSISDSSHYLLIILSLMTSTPAGRHREPG